MQQVQDSNPAYEDTANTDDSNLGQTDQLNDYDYMG